MREIKFRVWFPDNKQMSFTDDIMNLLFEDGHYYDHSGRTNGAIVMQFTGLKDQNGKEIYEGDIVKTGYIGNAKVIWPEKYIPGGERNEDLLCWCLDPIEEVKYMGIYGLDVQNNYEVIGNIWENSDLISTSRE